MKHFQIDVTFNATSTSRKSPTTKNSRSTCLLSCPVLSSPVLSCPVLSCPLLSCPLLSSPVLSCPPKPSFLSSPGFPGFSSFTPQSGRQSIAVRPSVRRLRIPLGQKIQKVPKRRVRRSKPRVVNETPRKPVPVEKLGVGRTARDKVDVSPCESKVSSNPNRSKGGRTIHPRTAEQ